MASSYVQNKSQIIIVLVALVLSSLSRADEPGKEFLDSVFNDIQDACVLKSQSDQCFALIEKMRTDPNYQHPTVKALLSHSLTPIGTTHPQALNIAYDIMSELIENEPKNDDFLGLRAIIRFQQDPIAGLWEAKVNNVPGIFSQNLWFYLKSGAIQRDIIDFAIAQFDKRIKNEKPIHSVLFSAKYAHERIMEYGDESEANAFLTYARDSIPWAAWRQGEWAEIASKTEFSPDRARSKLYTFCQTIMLRLDQGENCSEYTTLLNERATEEVLSNAALKSAAGYMIKAVETVQPTSIGNALQLLKKLAGDEHLNEDQMDQHWLNSKHSVP